MANDDLRRKILERRARLVMAALTTAGLSAVSSGCCDDEPARICLTVAPATDVEELEPTVCLKISAPGDSAAPASSKPKSDETEPEVCLTAPAPSGSKG